MCSKWQSQGLKLCVWTLTSILNYSPRKPLCYLLTCDAFTALSGGFMCIRLTVVQFGEIMSLYKIFKL